MAGKLDGKVAIITGASAGIGEATVIALAAVGTKGRSLNSTSLKPCWCGFT
jgi:NAD(P)-dependent dehydrogenase (short-subunit alcohol dehydrogenase family)